MITNSYAATARCHFLPAGRKPHDSNVSTSNNNEGTISEKELPHMICDITAPFMEKEKKVHAVLFFSRVHDLL